MKFNKTILSIGTLAAIVAPVATVVACGDAKAPTTTPTKTNPKNIDPTTTPTKTNPKNIDPASKPTHVDPVTTNTDSTNVGTKTIPVDHPSSVQQKPVVADNTKLSPGILDYRKTPVLTNQQLNDAFDKFNKDMKYVKQGTYGSITAATRRQIDLNRDVIKVMLVTDTNSNHGLRAIYFGIIGYEKNSNALYFTFRDAHGADDINNDGGEGSEKQLKLFDRDPGDGTLFDLINGKDKDDIMDDLENLAKSLKI